jgi:plasmid maintenance system antidote protein VapI
MDITTYLARRGESQKAFAKRAGINQSTINDICRGAGMNADTALRIITATIGAVGLEDLVSKGG